MPKSIIIFYLFLLPFFATAQTADFTFQTSDGLFCNPSTVQFTQACTGNPIGFYWDFGNNTQGYTGDIAVTYTTAGTFTVRLIAIYEQNTVEVSKTIVINPKVITSIGYDKNYICNPGVINFTATATGNIANYSWDFGDTSGLVSAITKDTTHNYVNFGNYNVTLIATDTTGCSGTSKTTIKVIKPPVVATTTPSFGCIPIKVLFNTTVNVPVNDLVTDYSWNYGDGSPITTTTVNNTNHTYNTVGAYYPTLNITTKDGCTNSYNFPGLVFGTPPTDINAYAKKIVVCGSETPEFVAKATNANRYSWNFGDGATDFIADTIIKHKYTSLGRKTVTVVPYFNGCPGVSATFEIEVVGVIAKYDYSNTCTDKKTYAFNNTSLGNISSYAWNFGDSTFGNTRDITHSFPDTGQFITSLFIVDSTTSCSDTYFKNIYTASPVLNNPDSSICKNINTSFSVLNTYTNDSTTYTWNVMGKKIGPLGDSALTIKADSLGIFNNFVSINYGAASCPDTIQLLHSLLVRGPDLKYNSPSPICLNTPTTITNGSKPFVAEDSITLMYWNYGNTIINDTVYQPSPFQYKFPGNYRVILTASDIKGCQDSLIHFVKVNPNPFLAVVPHSDTLCAGQTDTLIVFSSNNVLWSPAGNISCTNCDTVAISPTITTMYYVTATTNFNCSVQDSVIVTVFAPFTATASINNLYICLGDQVQLNVDPKNTLISWSPSIGLNNPASFTPIASPLQSTTYTAILRDSVGCFTDSVSVSVAVKTLPTVNAGPDQIVPYNSHFTISPVYSSNVAAYTWAPSALLSCSNCAIPGGIASYSENYTIKVISDSGCVAADSINILVECKSANIFMPGAFTPNNDNLNDYYYPITRGIKTVLKFVIFNREGKIVYQAQNFSPNSKSFAWDGTYKGANQPQGGYVYILEAVCDLGEKLSKSGSFMLLR